MLDSLALAAAIGSFMIAIAGTPTAAGQMVDEMAILDEYLARFDTWRGAEGVGTTVVFDRCHRNGGTEESSKVPVTTSADATNDLMFQHAKWHGDHGGFLEPVYTWSDSDPYGIEFLEYHGNLVRTYNDWRVSQGHAVLTPWDPMTPIPPDHAYDVAAPCLARKSGDPQVALPSFLTTTGGSDRSPFWGYTSLCQIPDANRLGKTIEDSWYHADVHLSIGGDMAEAGFTLRDPIFWPWHAHVQGIHDAWTGCTTNVTVEAADPASRDAPGGGAAGWLTAVALIVIARRDH